MRLPWQLGQTAGDLGPGAEVGGVPNGAIARQAGLAVAVEVADLKLGELPGDGDPSA